MDTCSLSHLPLGNLQNYARLICSSNTNNFKVPLISVEEQARQVSKQRARESILEA